MFPSARSKATTSSVEPSCTTEYTRSLPTSKPISSPSMSADHREPNASPDEARNADTSPKPAVAPSTTPNPTNRPKRLGMCPPQGVATVATDYFALGRKCHAPHRLGTSGYPTAAAPHASIARDHRLGRCRPIHHRQHRPPPVRPTDGRVAEPRVTNSPTPGGVSHPCRRSGRCCRPCDHRRPGGGPRRSVRTAGLCR